MVIGLAACEDSSSSDRTIRFATSGDYPPFEYYQEGKLDGFDIQLAKLISKEMGREAVFQDMQFSGILAALQGGTVDAGIATIAITEERKRQFDFSKPYYAENIAVIFKSDEPVLDRADLVTKKMACQLGSVMEGWLRNKVGHKSIVVMDQATQAVESLKAGHVEGVVVDGVQAAAFIAKNPNLSYNIVEKSDIGYGIAFKKGSPLVEEVNKALNTLITKGELKRLEEMFLKQE